MKIRTVRAALILCAAALSNAQAQTVGLVDFGSSWRYLDDGSNRFGGAQPFYSLSFDDASWSTGQARLGYGGDGEVTTVSFGGNANAKYITTYFRNSFDLSADDLAAGGDLVVQLVRDDGAAVFLNGTEIVRDNLPAGTLTSNTQANSAAGGSDETRRRRFEVDRSLLRVGTNVVAASVHQANATSSDLGFDLSLVLERELFFAAEFIDGESDRADFFELVDIDNDGDLDVLTVFDAANDGIRLQRNLGHGVIDRPVEIESDFSSIDHLEVADLNADGLPDLLGAGTGSSRIRSYLQRADGSFQRGADTNNNGELRALVLGDFDSDGVPDIAHYDGTGATVRLVWRKGDGSGGFGFPIAVAAATTNSMRLSIADVDNDGDLDLAVSEYVAGSIYWYPNVGGSFGARRILASGITNISSLRWADFDGDGSQDLLYLIGVDNFSNPEVDSQLRWMANNGAGTFAEQGLIFLDDSENITGIEIFDIDLDGDLDLFAGDGRTIYLIDNDGAGGFRAPQALDGIFTWGYHTKAGDLDGNGFPDLLVLETFSPKGLSWFENRTGVRPRVAAFAPDDNTLEAAGSVTLTWDVEAATRIEIDGVDVTSLQSLSRAVTADTTFTLTASNASGTTTAFTSVFLPEQIFAAGVDPGTGVTSQSLRVAAGDLDGDGFDDIAYFDSNADRAGWLPSDGSGGFLARRNIDTNFNAVGSGVLDDLDGDGDIDLFLGAFSGHPRFYRNLGGGNFSAGAQVGLTPNGSQGLHGGDLDGDGDTDVVAHGENGSIWMFRNDGSGGFTRSELALGSPQSMALGDFDGDGSLDVMGFFRSSIRVFWNNGDGTEWTRFDVITGMSGSNNSLPVLAGDVTGDGRDDFFFTTSSRVVVMLEADEHRQFKDSRAVVNYTGEQFYALSLADLDADGDADFAAYPRQTFGPGILLWFEGDGHGSFSQEIIEGDDEARGRQLVAFDPDGDGDLDLFMPGDRGDLVFENTADPATAPVIQSLVTDRPLVHSGNRATLSWDVTGSTFELTLAPGVGRVVGNSVDVFPDATTTYTLTARNSAGTVSQQVTVEAVQRPVVQIFRASETLISQGDQVTLSWEVGGADTLLLSPQGGDVSGTNSITLRIDETTNFSLLATNADGEDEATVRVAVDPVRCGFVKIDQQTPLVRGNHGSSTFDGQFWYFTEPIGNSWRRYDSSFNFIERVVPQDGTGLDAIAYDSQAGTLITFDGDDDLVREVSLSGQTVRVLFGLGAGANVGDLVIDQQDHTIWMVTRNNNVPPRVEHRRFDGALLSSFTTPGQNWSGIALDPRNNTLLLFEFEDTLWEFTRQGDPVAQLLEDEIEGNDSFLSNGIGIFYMPEDGLLFVNSQNSRMTVFADRSRALDFSDETPPTIIGAKDFVANVEPGGAARVSFADIKAIDAEDGEVAVGLSRSDQEPFPVGITEVEATARDCSGNVARATFHVVVLEIFASPGNQSVEVVAMRGDGSPAVDGDPFGNNDPAQEYHIFNRAVLNAAGEVLMSVATRDADGRASGRTGLFTNVGGDFSALAYSDTQRPVADEIGRFWNLALNDGGAPAYQTHTERGSRQLLASAIAAEAGAIAPGTAGRKFSLLHQPALAADGELFTPAHLELRPDQIDDDVISDTGIWASSSGLIALEGRLSPLAGASYGHLYSRVVVAASGEIAFACNLAPAPAAAVFAGLPGALVPVTVTGDLAPGTDGRFASFQAESISPNGAMLIRATLALGGGIDAGNNGGLWSNRSGQLELIAREGDPAPCLEGSRAAVFQRFSEMAIAADGTITFMAYLAGPTVGSGEDGSIWRSRPGGHLQLVAREGDRANNTTDRYSLIRSLAFSREGGLAFVASIDDGRSGVGVWLDRGEDLAPQLALRRGDEFAPSPGNRRAITGMSIERQSNAFGGTGGYGRSLNDQGQLLVQLSLDHNDAGVFMTSAEPGNPSQLGIAAPVRGRSESVREDPARAPTPPRSLPPTSGTTVRGEANTAPTRSDRPHTAPRIRENAKATPTPRAAPASAIVREPQSPRTGSAIPRATPVTPPLELAAGAESKLARPVPILDSSPAIRRAIPVARSVEPAAGADSKLARPEPIPDPSPAIPRAVPVSRVDESQRGASPEAASPVRSPARSAR